MTLLYTGTAFQFKHCTIISRIAKTGSVQPYSFQFKHCTIISSPIVPTPTSDMHFNSSIVRL